MFYSHPVERADNLSQLAAGDADAAEAHMRFAFSSRETNPFDQVKQLRERTTLMYGSL